MKYFYECGICECLHPAWFNGDCREDNNRFFVDELDEVLGAENWAAVSMSEADEWPAPAITKTKYSVRLR